MLCGMSIGVQMCGEFDMVSMRCEKGGQDEVRMFGVANESTKRVSVEYEKGGWEEMRVYGDVNVDMERKGVYREIGGRGEWGSRKPQSVLRYLMRSFDDGNGHGAKLVVAQTCRDGTSKDHDGAEQFRPTTSGCRGRGGVLG